jgi:biopolymer transport protein ExbD
MAIRTRRVRATGDMSLNITAMADIFVVLLVFLLKSYASGAMTITPVTGARLPTAHAKSTKVEALKVEISQTDLVLEGQHVAKLDNFQFEAKDRTPAGFSKALFGAIKDLKARIAADSDGSNAAKNAEKSARIIIIADKDTPYSSIKVILASAAGNGLTDFKLAVRGPD